MREISCTLFAITIAIYWICNSCRKFLRRCSNYQTSAFLILLSSFQSDDSCSSAGCFGFLSCAYIRFCLSHLIEWISQTDSLLNMHSLSAINVFWSERRKNRDWHNFCWVKRPQCIFNISNIKIGVPRVSIMVWLQLTRMCHVKGISLLSNTSCCATSTTGIRKQKLKY